MCACSGKPTGEVRNHGHNQGTLSGESLSHGPQLSPPAASSEKPPGVWPIWNLNCWKRFPKRPGSCSSATRRPPERSPAQMPRTASSPAFAAAPVSHTTRFSAKKGRGFKISNALKLIIKALLRLRGGGPFALSDKRRIRFTGRMRRLFTLKKRIFGENSAIIHLFRLAGRIL